MIDISKFIQIDNSLFINKHDKLLNILESKKTTNNNTYKLRYLIANKNNKILTKKDINFFTLFYIMGSKFSFKYLKFLSSNSNKAFNSHYNFLINKLIFNNNGINICLISDKNYCLPLLTLIKSLLINRCKSNIYNIFILYIDNDIEFIYDIQKFSEYNFYIKCIPCNFNTHGLKQVKHISPATYIKFDIPNIFKNFDKILYLDTDIIVFRDLMQLWKIPLDNYYLACVEDPLCYSIPDKDFRKRLNINNEKYFNAGVMLLNLKKLREDNLSIKLYDYSLKNDLKLVDQDAFNAIVGHNCKYIPYFYNITGTNERHLGFKHLKEKYFKYLKNDNWEKEGYIYHFTSTKPWQYQRLPYANIWYKYYSTLPKDIKNKYKI